MWKNRRAGDRLHSFVLHLSIVNIIVVFLAIVAVPGQAQSESGYSHKLDDLSFDVSTIKDSGKAWVTTNSAVPLVSKIKILPQAAQLNGQMFLKSKL